MNTCDVILSRRRNEIFLPPTISIAWSGADFLLHDSSTSFPLACILGAHLALASAYSKLGQIAEARAAAAAVLRLSPKFSLAVFKERAPTKDPALLERGLAALRKAGLK